MDFRKTMQSLMRRPLVVATTVVVGLVAAMLAFVITPLTYESISTLVFTVSSSGSAVDPDTGRPAEVKNPLLGFDDGLAGARDVVIKLVTTPQTMAQLGAPEGGPTTLTITSQTTDPALLGSEAPFLFITATSTSAEEARETVARTETFVQNDLLERQDALTAKPDTYVTLFEVVAPTAPAPQYGSLLERVAIGLVLGMLAAVASWYAAACLRERRMTHAGAADEVNLLGTPADLTDDAGATRPNDTSADAALAEEVTETGGPAEGSTDAVVAEEEADSGEPDDPLIVAEQEDLPVEALPVETTVSLTKVRPAGLVDTGSPEAPDPTSPAGDPSDGAADAAQLELVATNGHRGSAQSSR